LNFFPVVELQLLNKVSLAQIKTHFLEYTGEGLMRVLSLEGFLEFGTFQLILKELKINGEGKEGR